jgi:hypothetical protein
MKAGENVAVVDDTIPCDETIKVAIQAIVRDASGPDLNFELACPFRSIRARFRPLTSSSHLGSGGCRQLVHAHRLGCRAVRRLTMHS